MDGTTLLSRMGVLFSEDFGTVETAPEPEVIDPVFSANELASVRESAWRDGHAAGLQEAAETDIAAVRSAIVAIAAAFAAECEAAAVRADEAARAIARLLLDSLATIFPTLCARHGDAEVRAVVRALLPALTQEPEIIVRVRPGVGELLMPEMARLDPEFAARVRLVGCDAMLPGDVRIGWRNGAAIRDGAELWQQVAAVLLPAGLLRVDAAIRETVDGD